MRHLKDNKGFTLIELVVSIASATVVLGAASMLLLMCVRTQRDVLDAAREQQTARTVITMMENLASDREGLRKRWDDSLAPLTNMEVAVDENLETCHCGLYVIGDGSGITHSLSHASASGVHVARKILQKTDR